MPKTQKVWDPLIRIFHWSLVLFFIVAYLSGEDESAFHINAGYVVLGLVAFRLIWGVIGTHYARFTQFVRGPKHTLDYARSMVSGSPSHYTGHNPLGAYMVVALLVMLLIVSYTGLKLYAVEEGQGPLAGNNSIELIATAQASPGEDDDEHENDAYRDGAGHDESYWEEIHEISVNLTLLLVILHVGGVLVSSRLHHENLVKAMITGKKNISTD